MTRHSIASELLRFQLAEADALRRARGALGISDTDLSALRHLLIAEENDERFTARELAATVGISPAGATFLIDRLEREGYVRRERHPDDRRAVNVVSTIAPDSEVRAALGRIESPVQRVADALGEAEAIAVRAFLERLTAAMAEVDPSANGSVTRTPRRPSVERR